MSYDPLINEQVLLQQLQGGDEVAFLQLYDHYKRRLAGNFIRLLRDEVLAQDALQELFLKVWDGRARIDPEQSFRAYLFRISENMVIDWFRKAARDKELQSRLLKGSKITYSHIEEDLTRKENSTILHQIIDQLPPQRRMAFVLHKLEGKSYREVSDIMGISTSTINKHIYAANQFVRQQLLRSPDLSTAIITSIILVGIS